MEATAKIAEPKATETTAAVLGVGAVGVEGATGAVGAGGGGGAVGASGAVGATGASTGGETGTGCSQVATKVMLPPPGTLKRRMQLTRSHPPSASMLRQLLDISQFSTLDKQRYPVG